MTVEIRWDQVDNFYFMDGYNVYLKSNGDFVRQNNDPIEGTFYYFEDPEDGEYEVYLTSINGGQESEPSSIESFRIGDLPIPELTGVVSGGGSILGSLEEVPIEDNEVIGFISGGGSISGFLEDITIEGNELIGSISGGGSIVGLFESPAPPLNLKNHIVMVESEFKLISEFISPKIFPKTAVFTITEKSTGLLLLKFLNKDGEPAVPTSVHYKIDCDTHEVRGLTEIEEVGEEAIIELTESDNEIYKNKGTEQHVVTINIIHDEGRKMNIEKVYNVYPLRFLQEVE